VFKYLLLSLIVINLYGFEDYDFDGVEDKYDKCLNTSFEYLVDKDGCPLDKEYFGILNFELIVTILKDYESNTNISFSYEYNNILSDISTNINDRSDIYFDIGYKVETKKYTLKNYIGIKYPVNDKTISTTKKDYFIISSLDYYFLNNYYTTILAQYTNTSNTEINYKNYYNYNISFGILSNNYNFEIGYINSGSIYKSINDYNAINIAYTYYINKIYYIKSGYSPSLKDNSYSVYIGIGVNFE